MKKEKGTDLQSLGLSQGPGQWKVQGKERNGELIAHFGSSINDAEKVWQKRPHNYPIIVEEVRLQRRIFGSILGLAIPIPKLHKQDETQVISNVFAFVKFEDPLVDIILPVLGKHSHSSF